MGPNNVQPKWYTLKSKRKGGRKNEDVSGEVQIQFSIVDSANPNAAPAEIYQKFRTTLAAEDEDELSRLPSNASEDLEKDEDTSEETDDPSKPEVVETQRKKKRLARLRRKSIAARAYAFGGKDDILGIVFLEVSKVTDLPPERNCKYCISRSKSRS